MKHETYTTQDGEVIRYATPASEVAAFLARVTDAVSDPGVTEAQLIDLIYSKENPTLDQTIFEKNGAVTRAALENPVYWVMTDLLDRKRTAIDVVEGRTRSRS